MVALENPFSFYSAYQKAVTVELVVTLKIPVVPPSLFLLHSDVPAAPFSHY